MVNFKRRRPTIKDETPPQATETTRVEVTNKNTGEVRTLKDAHDAADELQDLRGKGPWGMVGVTISPRLSMNYNSVGIELSVQMPVSECTTLKRVDEAMDRLNAYMKRKVAKEVPEILELLRDLPRDR